MPEFGVSWSAYSGCNAAFRADKTKRVLNSRSHLVKNGIPRNVVCALILGRVLFHIFCMDSVELGSDVGSSISALAMCLLDNDCAQPN